MNCVSPRSSLGQRPFWRRRRSRERGVALVMVLGSLAILAVMLTEFQDETSADLGHALSERDGIRAEYAARSAVNLSRLLIASEPTIRKAAAPLMAFMGGPRQIPVWAFADSILGAFNDADGASRFKSLAAVNLEEGKALGMEGAGFELTIVDEDSKLNFNTAAKGDAFVQQRLAQLLAGLLSGQQFNPLFEERDGDGNFTTRQQLCSAIIDWTDPDQDTYSCDLTGNFVAEGSEDSYYQLLRDPYERKNAAFDSLDELHMVRGVTDDFWNAFVEPKPSDPDSRVVTVWGQGKVNVNTANAQTLLAVICGAAVKGTPLCEDQAEQAKFLMFVGILLSMSKGAPLFSSPQSFVNAIKGEGRGLVAPLMKMADLQPVTFQDDVSKSITTESKVFSIYATGIAKSGKRRTIRRVHAVVDFRGAPKPPDPFKGTLPRSLDQANLMIQNSQPKPATPENFDPESGLENAFRPDPGGRIIYYRIQ